MVYEFTPTLYSSQSEYKYCIVVDKSKTKSIYTANFYITNINKTFKDLQSQEPEQTNKFTISRNKNEGLYEFSSPESSASGKFNYNQKRIKCEIEYKATWLSTEAIFKQTLDICNYKNDIIGARSLMSTSASGQVHNSVYEFLSKDFYKSAKIGAVKDSKVYPGLTAVEEGRVGVDNAGDKYGFKVVYDNQSSLTPETANTLEYGLFPNE